MSDDLNITDNSTETEQFLVTDVGYPQWSLLSVVISMVVIMIIGVPGNGIIILIQTKLRSKFSTDYFIIHMAIVDLIASLLNAPLYIVRNIEGLWSVHASVTFCRVHSGLLYHATVCSCLLLSAIAVDRYLVTCRPVTRIGRNWNSKSRLLNILIAVTCAVFAIGIGSTHSYDPFTQDCYLLTTAGYILSVVLTFVFVILFVAAIFCYTKISLTIRHQQRLLRAAGVTQTDVRAVSGKCSTCLFQRQNKVAPSYDSDFKISNNPGLSPQNVSTSSCQNSLHRPNKDCKRQHSEMKSITENTDTATKSSASRPGPYSRRISRVTLIVFLLTAVYVLTWVINWIASIEDVKNETFRGIIHISRKLFMLNCITNPLFYIILSSKFRERTVKLFS